jgi:hypothetical protein
MHAMLAVGRRRRRAEMAEMLVIHTLAARGEPGEVKKRLADLTKDD